MSLKQPPHTTGGNCSYCYAVYTGIPAWSPCGHDGHLHVVQVIRKGTQEKLLLECDACNKNLIVP